VMLRTASSSVMMPSTSDAAWEVKSESPGACGLGLTRAG
jgi:hypothetical protein